MTDPRAALAEAWPVTADAGMIEEQARNLAERGVLLVPRSMLEGCLAEGIVDNALRRAVVAALSAEVTD
jgi:hypothetical protein